MNNMYCDAPFDVRRKLQTTFDQFGVKTSHEILGESLLRLNEICMKGGLRPCAGDYRASTLFRMLDFYNSLK